MIQAGTVQIDLPPLSGPSNPQNEPQTMSNSDPLAFEKGEENPKRAKLPPLKPIKPSNPQQGRNNNCLSCKKFRPKNQLYCAKCLDKNVSSRDPSALESPLHPKTLSNQHPMVNLSGKKVKKASDSQQGVVQCATVDLLPSLRFSISKPQTNSKPSEDNQPMIDPLAGTVKPNLPPSSGPNSDPKSGEVEDDQPMIAISENIDASDPLANDQEEEKVIIDDIVIPLCPNSASNISEEVLPVKLEPVVETVDPLIESEIDMSTLNFEFERDKIVIPCQSSASKVNEKVLPEPVVVEDKAARDERLIHNLFTKFIKERQNSSLEEVLKDKKGLQDILMQFFDSLQVKGQKVDKNTCLFYKSVLKRIILKESGGKIDIWNFEFESDKIAIPCQSSASKVNEKVLPEPVVEILDPALMESDIEDERQDDPLAISQRERDRKRKMAISRNERLRKKRREIKEEKEAKDECLIHNLFTKFIKERQNSSLEEVLKEEKGLQDTLMQFFDSLHVKGQKVDKNTRLFYKGVLKRIILKESGGKIDISNFEIESDKIVIPCQSSASKVDEEVLPELVVEILDPALIESDTEDECLDDPLATPNRFNGNPKKAEKKEKTLKKEQQVQGLFTAYIKAQGDLTLEELINDKTSLEDYLIQFFANYRKTVKVQGRNTLVRPAKNTYEIYRSFLKSIILQKSDDKLDISDQNNFTRFHKFYKNLTKKQENPELDEEEEHLERKAEKKEETLQNERQIQNLLTEFIEKRRNCSLEEILKDEKELQDILIQFFDSLSKTKKKTCLLYRSFLKTILFKESHGKIDISQPKFMRFNMYFQQSLKTLKGQEKDGKTEKTLRKERQILNLFKEFIEKRGNCSLEEILKDEKELQDVLIQFFDTLSKMKKNSVLVYRSFLKTIIFKKSHGKMDLSQPKFMRFNKYFQEFLKTLNDERPTIQTIPREDLANVFELGKVLHGILNRTNIDLTKIPQTWENKYHYLAQYITMIILQVNLGRKERDRMDLLKKTDFEIFKHPKVGRYYQKIVGESKYYDADSLVLESGGVIMFKDNEFGLNCGQYLKDYIAKLDPNCPYLFPRPMRQGKCYGFLHQRSVWYECTKIGVNQLGKSLPEVSTALGLTRYTNNILRPMTIQFMEESGFSNSEIMDITFHKKVGTLIPIPIKKEGIFKENLDNSE